MRTEDLIKTLAADAGSAPGPSLEKGACQGFAFGGSLAIVVFLTALGVRPDLSDAFLHPLIAMKTLLPLALGLLALLASLRTARPAVSPGRPARGALVVPVIALFLFSWAYVSTPGETRFAALLGQSLPVCLTAIPLLSLPLLAGLVTVLRTRGAPVNPALCGTFAGLSAAGFSAALYSLYCVEDTPLFYALWYGVGIGVVTGIGRLAGLKFMRW